MFELPEGIDLLIVENCLKNCPEQDVDVKAFLWYLSAVSRNGHLCLKTCGSTLFPPPASLKFSESIEKALTKQELENLESAVIKGAKKLPESLITDAGVQTAPAYPETPVCKNGSFYYFQKSWVFETFFLHHLNAFIAHPPAFAPAEEAVKEKVNQLFLSGKLNEEQKNALLFAFKSPLTIITGGPGTGKTYTAGHLIGLILDLLGKENQKNFKIALAAPTGKAASNLNKSLEKALGENENIPKATTLHALLADDFFSSSNALNKDLVLIDESSMIDMRLMAELFFKLKPGSRLILLGDKNQLPPVEAGCFFSDLIALKKQESLKNTCLGELKQTVRTNQEGMIAFASGLIEEDKHLVKKLLEGKYDSVTYQEFPADNLPLFERELLKKSLKYLPPDSAPLEEQLFSFNAFRLLSPLRKGVFGSERIGLCLQNFFKTKQKQSDQTAVPIMITGNDKTQNLFNGETGLLIEEKGAKPYAVFLQGSAFNRLPAFLLPKYELAFCISVHKSQGSEFDHVLLILPPGSESFGKEVLYTAATRAKKSLEIWGCKATLEQILTKQNIRLSGVQERMCSSMRNVF